MMDLTLPGAHPILQTRQRGQAPFRKAHGCGHTGASQDAPENRMQLSTPLASQP